MNFSDAFDLKDSMLLRDLSSTQSNYLATL
ncbi:hypothetical protein DERF_001667 [Dermatophagoides farinae]|uniref:Uncharacterized protein n=1 Tax=Dermatophagoides farinae TaxID=6954 RepID=A0A922IAX2_DERFA|nr:hypothetical protein DERF_001667 [Dermatophagoides farinae]